MMMSRLLTRAQLGRVTRWVRTQFFPSSTIPSKQCSTTVTNDPSSIIQRKWPEHVVPLTCRSSASSGFCQVYLVGTVHISQKSCAEVQEIIDSLKPEVVFVELCSSRKGALKQKKYCYSGAFIYIMADNTRMKEIYADLKKNSEAIENAAAANDARFTRLEENQAAADAKLTRITEALESLLDRDRGPNWQHGVKNSTTAGFQVPTVEEIVNAMWKKKSNNKVEVVFSLLYAQLATELKVIPGSEFRVAYEEATKYGGRVVLGDRPIQITLTRAWRKMPLREKARFFTGLFRMGSSRSSEVLRKWLEGIDCDIDMDLVTHLEQEMYEMFPTLWKTLLHERDLYMSKALLQVAKESKCVVAIVGRGHLQGIKKHWEQPILVNDLLKIPPPPKPAMSTIILTSVGVVVAGVSMILGYLN